MIKEFQQYIDSHCLIGSDERVVVALSGGVDSMVLAELLRRSGYKIVFAHCNFHLRGEESDGDEQFVHDYAKRVGVELYVKHFDTTQYADNQKISIEMAARELRYAWFNELVNSNENFSKVAIAHHADDQIETFFINLLRGSGIKGLKAMQPRNGLFIRPLLWASREQIKDFATENGIEWREDRTNKETVYFRNKIRHELLPVLDGIKPDAREKIRLSIECLSTENQLYRELLKERLSRIEKVEGVLHSIEKIEFSDNLQLLFEWARDFGFAYSQCETIFSVLNSESGKEFYSNDYQLVVEKNTIEIFPSVLNPNPDQNFNENHSASRRDAISITPDQCSEANAIWGSGGYSGIIEANAIWGSGNGGIIEANAIWGSGNSGNIEANAIWGISKSGNGVSEAKVFPKPSDFHLEKCNPNLAQLDADRLEFPLKLRHWRQGDRFRPLGMHGSKLVSDFYNDLNFSAFKKKTTWILTDDDDQIVWIVGHRIDDRFKITEKTIRICEIKLG